MIHLMQVYTVVVVLTSLHIVQLCMCQSTYDTKRGSVRSLNEVYWMHIQKTSSWLGDMLLRWGCADIDKGYHVSPEENIFLADRVRFNLSSWKCDMKIITTHDHYGHHVPYETSLKGATVTMFRKPIDRLISAFLFADGIMIPRGYPNYELEPQIRANITAAQYPIYAYGLLPGISQCQSKMVLGHHCGSIIPKFSKIELKEAQRRIAEDFAFIGLTEESKATYDLFIAMFGPGHLTDVPTMRPVYAMSYRKNYVHSTERNKELAILLRRLEWRDGSDEFVYNVAKSIFYKRCKEYGIATIGGPRN